MLTKISTVALFCLYLLLTTSSCWAAIAFDYCKGEIKPKADASITEENISKKYCECLEGTIKGTIVLTEAEKGEVATAVKNLCS